MSLSDIPCVTPPIVTTSPINSICLGEADSFVSHTTIFKTDYSCTSTIKTVTKTVTAMSSSVLTDQVSSDTQAC